MGELKQAWRWLLSRPGFTAAAVLTLALGIGATTAIFSVVYGVLFRPLPYPEPERLVWAGGSMPDFADVAARARSFSGLATTASNIYAADLGGGSAVRMRGDVVTPSFFAVTGAAPELGRAFTAADERQRVAVIADRLWRGPYASDPAVVGRVLRLNGKPYTIIGVMPSALRLPSPETLVWTPLEEAIAGWPERDNRQLRIARAVGRLAPGVELAAAQGELDGVMRQLGAEHPRTNADVGMVLVPLHQAIAGQVRPALLVLLGTVALVLLIAAGNVANLMLARTVSRERELAIRLALGARRHHLARMILTESLLLALAGGALGVLFAMWGVSLLVGLSPADFPRVDEIAVDVPVLGFALAVSLAVACLFALAPIFGVLRPPLAAFLSSARTATEGRQTGRLRGALVVAQVALSLVLVTGAALLLASLVNLMSTERGYDSQNLLTFTMPPGDLAGEAGMARHQRLLERAMQRIAELPGVVAVGGANSQPPDTLQRETRFVADGRPEADADDSPWIVVTPDYFRALGARMVDGRPFRASDTDRGEPVIAVNRSLARRLAPGRSPLGMRLRLLVPGVDPVPRTIVGVVDDVKYSGLAQDGESAIFTPWAQTPWPGMYVAVRTGGEPMAPARAISQAIAGIDPTQSVMSMRSMEDVTADALVGPRFYGVMLGLFGALALVLVAIGVYGVIAYDVALRTREIGIRLALGARPRAVVAMMVRRGSLLAMAGIAIGVAGGVAATRLLAGMLYGVGVADPRVFAGAALLLLAVAVVASLGAARRATRVDPMQALRAE
ncbi:MAG TPA: ABC transporter permease [Kofleriaceae bacterium]|nr:ABC transporter permease [Kofleriaceae bacterium]